VIKGIILGGNNMKKKTRDLKRHYRNLERRLRNYNIVLSDESWYRLWHIHLDWLGITSVSEKHRKNHFMYYLKIFEKIERLTKGNKRDFQAWIYFDGCNGYDDAFYFHTENPDKDFPYWLDDIEWNVEIPSTLLSLVDTSKFNIGRLEIKNKYSYIIQKKGLGLEINKQIIV